MKATTGPGRGKCTNISGCLLAYRGEEIDIAAGQPFVCSECGKPLASAGASSGRIAWLVAGAALLAVCLGVALAWPKFRALFGNTPQSSEAQAHAPSTETNKPPTDATPQNSGAPEPLPEIAAPQKIDLNIASAENRRVKDEVLTRVDLMPISQTNKDKLYSSVERARQMGKVLTIPFSSGKTSLGAPDIQGIKTELQKPALAQLRDDPTAVFVILGFADPSGDAKKNLQISQQRADSVLAALRDKCGVANVLHAVAMGGSTLLDAKNVEKNRVVEIWAVLP